MGLIASPERPGLAGSLYIESHRGCPRVARAIGAAEGKLIRTGRYGTSDLHFEFNVSICYEDYAPSNTLKLLLFRSLFF